MASPSRTRSFCSAIRFSDDYDDSSIEDSSNAGLPALPGIGGQFVDLSDIPLVGQIIDGILDFFSDDSTGDTTGDTTGGTGDTTGGVDTDGSTGGTGDTTGGTGIPHQSLRSA